MGEKREMLILPYKWHAVIMYYHLCQKHTASEFWLYKNQTLPPFQRSIFLKPYFQWEGLNVKLNKRNSLTSTLLHTMWVPDHSIQHPMQTPTNGERKGCMMGCSKGRQVRDTEHTNNTSPNSLQRLHYCIKEKDILTKNEIQIVWFKTQNKQSK